MTAASCPNCKRVGAELGPVDKEPCLCGTPFACLAPEHDPHWVLDDPHTPRPWPENVEPTVEQFTDWLLSCTPDERVEVVGKLLAGSRQASVCFTQDHQGAIRGLAAAHERARAEYDRGFRDACQKISAGIANVYQLPAPSKNG